MALAAAQGSTVGRPCSSSSRHHPACAVRRKPADVPQPPRPRPNRPLPTTPSQSHPPRPGRRRPHPARRPAQHAEDRPLQRLERRQQHLRRQLRGSLWPAAGILPLGRGGVLRRLSRHHSVAGRRDPSPLGPAAGSCHACGQALELVRQCRQVVLMPVLLLMDCCRSGGVPCTQGRTVP